MKAVGKRTFTLSLPAFLVPAAGAAGELLTAFDKKPRLINRQKAMLDAQQRLAVQRTRRRAQDFGFEPRVRMAEGTRRAYEWYVENKWL